MRHRELAHVGSARDERDDRFAPRDLSQRVEERAAVRHALEVQRDRTGVLFGAQVIPECERLARSGAPAPAQPFTTEAG